MTSVLWDRKAQFSVVAAYREKRAAAGFASAAEQFCPVDRRNYADIDCRIDLASSAGTSLSQEWFMKLRENGSDLERSV